MLYSIKNKENLEKLEELASLQSQVEEKRLQDNLGKLSFQKILEKVFEPVTDTIKIISESFTKTLTESSIKNNKALENFNEKV